jgi:hypothetical protein
VRRAVRLGTVLVTVGALSACALPHRKDLEDVSKPAATTLAAGHVVADFTRQRVMADSRLDVDLLARIEQGSLLDLDSAAYFVRTRLGGRQEVLRLEPSGPALSGRFTSYPVWFVVPTTVRGQRLQALALFARRASTTGWKLAYAPRLAESTPVPAVAAGDDHSAVVLDPDEPLPDLDLSPAEAVRRYVAFLADPDSDHADDFVADSFVAQMRRLQAAEPKQPVGFTQTWSNQPVRYALALSDGGAMVFATLVRTDRYDVRRGRSLSWQGVSQAAAFLPGRVSRRATLTYLHQVVLVLPADGSGFVIGQYGGLVGATGS